MASKKRVVVERWDEKSHYLFEGPGYEVMEEIMRILIDANVAYRGLEFEHNSDGEYVLTGIAR